MAYIGDLGRLVQLYSNPALDESSDSRVSLRRTVAGNIKAQRRGIARRSWSMRALGAKPGDQAVLRDFASGRWGIGPWRFLPPDALTVNALLPSTSSLENVFGAGVGSEGGPWEVESGKWLPNSHLLSGGVLAFESKTPAIPGKPVTASAYVQGAGSAVRVQFFDATDTLISTHTSTVAGTAAGVTRSHITVTPPAGTVHARVLVNVETTRAGGPALTWTSELRPYGDGRGCEKAIVMDYETTLRRANIETWSDDRFTIQEVG